jgi:adenylate cyclase
LRLTDEPLGIYCSDKVICVFGLPIAQVDDADRAIQSALEVLISVPPLLKKLIDDEGTPIVPVNITLSIASGVVSGSFCEYNNRSTLAVVGEPLPLATSLAMVARTYGARLLMDSPTQTLAKRAFDTREIDIVLQPGTPDIIPVFDVVAAVQGASDNDRRTGFICYELGLGEYRQRNFDAALTYFRKSKALMPEDGPAAVMIDRCKRAVDDPALVPSDWNGLWVWDKQVIG